MDKHNTLLREFEDLQKNVRINDELKLFDL